MWTSTEINERQYVNGELYVWFRFTNDIEEYFDAPPYKSSNPPPGWPQSLVDAKLEELNGFDTSLIVKGTSKPVPAVKPATQDELDLRAFGILCQSYRATKDKLAAAATAKIDTKVSQSDLDSILGEIKTAYKPQPEYDALMQGLF